MKTSKDGVIARIVMFVDEVVTSPLFAIILVALIILYAVLSGQEFPSENCGTKQCEDGDIEFYRQDPRYGW